MLRVTSRLITFGVCALLCGTLTAAAGAQATSELERLRSQFVGSYRLAWYKSYDAAGRETTLPWVSGQISFERAGRMSVFLVGRDRARFTSGSPSESERAAARFFEFTNGGATLFLTIREGERMVGRLQWDRYP